MRASILYRSTGGGQCLTKHLSTKDLRRPDVAALAAKDILLERFQLDPTKKTGSYSKGNRQKVALVAGLASDAELLLLDEPTSGLDPLMEAVFQDCIREVKAQGRTVLLSSHILAEVEALCDRLSIIRLGRVVEGGTLAELRHLTRTSITAETVRPAQGLAGLEGLHDLEIDDQTRSVFVMVRQEIHDAIRHSGIPRRAGLPALMVWQGLRRFGYSAASRGLREF